MSAIHCDAFPAPQVIPLELQIEGDFDHTKPFPGDGGIRFEPLERLVVTKAALS